MIRLEIPGLPKNINTTRGSSWRVSQGEKAKWRRLIARALLNKLPPKPFEMAHITYTRVSSVQGDLDNTVASFKYVQDALKYVGVIKDDSPKHITAEYNWVKGKPKEGHIIITVKNLSST